MLAAHMNDNHQPVSDNPEGRPLLAVKNLSYEYGTLLALDDISFELWPGELVALVGRNGAGKSTLLRCMAGWTRATDGEVCIGGIRIQDNERSTRRNLSLVPDTPPFYDDLTAWEHLQLVAQTHRIPGWQATSEKLLNAFGLMAGCRGYPFTFSRGMRYKLALCLALLVEPRILLLDEPLGPLDPVSAAFLWNELERRRSDGMAILLSSHQLPPDVQPDRYLVLEQGYLIADGTPAELTKTLEIEGPVVLDRLLDRAITVSEAEEDA